MDESLRALIRRFEADPDDAALLHEVEVAHERAGVRDLPMSALLRIERWRRVVGLVRKWFREPLGEERVTVAAMNATEERLGRRLPRAVRELHRLLEHRRDVMWGSRVIPLAELPRSTELRVFRGSSLYDADDFEGVVPSKLQDDVDPRIEFRALPRSIVIQRGTSAELCLDVAITDLLRRVHTAVDPAVPEDAWRDGLAQEVQGGRLMRVAPIERLMGYVQVPADTVRLMPYVDADTIVAAAHDRVSMSVRDAVVFARTAEAWDRVCDRLGAIVSFAVLRRRRRR